MPSLKEQEGFFDEAVRLEIRADFVSKCVLGKEHLKANEGHPFPLMEDARMVGRTVRGIYHKVLTPYAAANSLYACQPCAHQWLMAPDDECPRAALVPCIPLMLYALHVLGRANEEAPCLQTLDEIFEDLKNNLHLTEEHSRASPFLDCYQLHPVCVPDESNPPPTTLVVQPSPSTYCSYKQDSKTTHYCILEHDGGPAPTDLHPSTVPLYQREGEDDVITLWRIPMRSPGLIFCYAESLVFEKTCNPTLYEVVWELLQQLHRGRGLPPGYRTIDVASQLAVFDEPFNISPASSKFNGLSTKAATQFDQVTLPLDRDSSSESDPGVENEASTSYSLSMLPFLFELTCWLSMWFS
ncbi:hypothetical protein PENSPDRAFT_656475 [Peniophora sp. CONT]|nr:hypothetical protein PENSPDRAFT_656475 [Peniophora sp. CONT]